VRFSDLLEETKHFRRRRQKKVAKIVHCGEPKSLSKAKEEAARESGLWSFVMWNVT
jgi:hypothetical protein